MRPLSECKTPLPARLVSALDNLARKQAGEDVAWINISAAQALTELGLAQRTPEGWRITSNGLLAQVAATPTAAAQDGAISLSTYRSKRAGE
jgi:hypothetical protein